MTTPTDFTPQGAQFRYGIDYLAVTLPTWNRPQDVLPKFCMRTWNGEILDRGSPGYNRSIVTDYGKVCWHSELPKQKVHTIISGQNLENMTAQGIDHVELLEDLHSKHGLIKRIDCAADTFNPIASPKDLYDAWNEKQIDTLVEVHEWHVSGTRKEPGMTFCLGARKENNRYVRVYDRISNLKGKGFILPDGVTSWTRVELEAKEDLAPRIGLAMREYGIIPTVKQALQESLRTKIDWLNSLLYSAEWSYIQPIGKKETNRYDWLAGLVFKSMDEFLRECQPGEGLALVKQYHDMLAEAEQRLRKAAKTAAYWDGVRASEDKKWVEPLN